MKKLLLVLLLMSITSLGYCGPIDTSGYPVIITADDVSINWLNNFRKSAVNTLNSFPGGNIQSTTISADAMENNSNPEIRWGESFSDFVYTGLLPATGTRAAAIITAGTAYIKNDTTNKMTRVVKDAITPGATKYEATKDIYVDLSNTGVYTYTAVANGASAPVIATNSVRLAKVVTDATDVTSVTDLRVTGIQLSTSEDFYLKGMKLYPSTLTAISADSGIVYNGTTRIAKTSATILTLSTASDWYDGATHTYGGGAGFCYVGVNSSGSIKLLYNNAPDYHDTSGTTAGDKYYWKNGTTYWRVIGSGWVTTGNQFITTGNLRSGDTEQFWNKVQWVTYNSTTDVINNSYPTGITITNVGTGSNLVTWSVNFSNAYYCLLATVGTNGPAVSCNTDQTTKVVGSVRVYSYNTSSAAAADVIDQSVLAFGN